MSLSLVQKAIDQNQSADHQEAACREAELEHHRKRYVELILSGDDSADAMNEMAVLLFQLEDELTPEAVLADERAIHRANQLMRLLCDREEAERENRHHRQKARAYARLGKETAVYLERVASESAFFLKRTNQAPGELRALQKSHPHLFEDSAGVPVLKGTDLDALTEEPRDQLKRERIYAHLQRCEYSLVELESLNIRENHPDELFFELWKREREQERSELLRELKAAGGSVQDYGAWRAAAGRLPRPHLMRKRLPIEPTDEDD